MRDNPVRIQGVIVSLITSLALWGLSMGPEIPTELENSLLGLVAVVAAVIGERIGKYVQGHFTEPKGVMDEIIANLHGEEADVSRYDKARAHDETDHLPKGM